MLLESRFIVFCCNHDPFDRMIIAQALTENCALVSSDQRFPLYGASGLRVLWD